MTDLLIKLLLHKRADTCLSNSTLSGQYTSLQYAKMFSNKEVISLLKEGISETPKDLYQSPEHPLKIIEEEKSQAETTSTPLLQLEAPQLNVNNGSPPKLKTTSAPSPWACLIAGRSCVIL
jgi:hypothetical protein